ncbi:MAG: HlyD family secretion protein [Rhodanobacteraceae bacterium]
MDGLFRQEAVEAQRPQTLGAIRLAVPVSHRIWGFFAAAVTVAIVLWLCLGHYTRREHVTGSLVPEAGLLTMSAPSAGTIVRVAVKPGEHVHAGQTLLTVSGDRASAALGDTDAAVARALQQQQAQIRATLAALPAQVSDQATDLQRRITMLGIQIRQFDAQLALQRKEAVASTDLLKKIVPLHRQGIISTVEFDQYQATALSEQAGIKTIENQRLDAAQQRSQLRAQLAQLPLTTAATRHQLRGQLAQLAATTAQNDVARDTVLRATSNGTITSLLVKPGQTLQAGQPVVSILPQGSPLEAQLLVPSSAIGFVHKGTPVVLHYQAFPYQKFGVQHGTVLDVSRSALTPAELTSLLGQAPPPTPLYRVEVKLTEQSIQAYGKQQALLPGMALSADLLLDHRRMIQWIFEPLYGMAKRGGHA